MEHRQLVFFNLRELVIIWSHYRCSSLKETCGMTTFIGELRSLVQEFLLVLIIRYIYCAVFLHRALFSCNTVHEEIDIYMYHIYVCACVCVCVCVCMYVYIYKQVHNSLLCIHSIFQYLYGKNELTLLHNGKMIVSKIGKCINNAIVWCFFQRYHYQWVKLTYK